MMGLIGMGNNPMVGATVAVAVSFSQASFRVESYQKYGKCLLKEGSIKIRSDEDDIYNYVSELIGDHCSVIEEQSIKKVKTSAKIKYPSLIGA